jgi:hypothetical protein
MVDRDQALDELETLGLGFMQVRCGRENIGAFEVTDGYAAVRGRPQCPEWT